MPGSQKSRRSSCSSSRARTGASSPAAQVPMTRAPALDPEARVGRSPSSSSTVRKPVCAKNEKKPDDMVRANGPSFRCSRRVISLFDADIRASYVTAPLFPCPFSLPLPLPPTPTPTLSGRGRATQLTE